MKAGHQKHVKNITIKAIKHKYNIKKLTKNQTREYKKFEK